MNTLQLYISKSGDGTTRLAEINPSEEGRRASADMKAAVALVDYPASAKIVFFIVVNVSDGYAIHVIRTIPPTRPNHLDATIFIDKRLDVMAEDMAEILDKVSKIVLAKSVTEKDMSELRTLFAKEYDLRDSTPRIKASRGRDFARLSYGDNSDRTLSDILDEGLYQPEWSGYKGVILLDDTIAMLPNSVVDLDYDEDEEIEDEDETAGDENVIEGRADANATHSYVFSLPVVLPGGRSALEFELETAAPMKQSPVAGYEVIGQITAGTDRSNKLRRSKGKTLYERLERWIWGLGGVIAGIILMAVVGLFKSTPSSPSSSPSTSSHATEQRQTDQEQKVAVTTSEAVIYLDSNRIWRRDDMEKIDGLSGLFDDLNNYRFEEITGRWAESLGGSVNFTKVINAAKKSMAKNIDPMRAEEHNPRYNREGDTAIGWLGYTFWIDP